MHVFVGFFSDNTYLLAQEYGYKYQQSWSSSWAEFLPSIPKARKKGRGNSVRSSCNTIYDTCLIIAVN